MDSNRVEDVGDESPDERLDPSRLVVAYPEPAVVASPEHLTPWQPRVPCITQDEENDCPANNTRSQATCLSIMDEVMLTCAQFGEDKYKIDPRKAASQSYPSQLLRELAGAVLDNETGNLRSIDT